MASLPISSLWQTDSRIDLTCDASSVPRIGDIGGDGTVGRQKERERESQKALTVSDVLETDLLS